MDNKQFVFLRTLVEHGRRSCEGQKYLEDKPARLAQSHADVIKALMRRKHAALFETLARLVTGKDDYPTLASAPSSPDISTLLALGFLYRPEPGAEQPLGARYLSFLVAEDLS